MCAKREGGNNGNSPTTRNKYGRGSLWAGSARPTHGPGAYYPRAITQPAVESCTPACNTFSLERRREHLHYMLGDFRLTITPV
jgi:hypothetical protein